MATLRIELLLPQLDRIGDILMASLATISEALTSLESTLDQELTEIAAALAGHPSQEEVDAVAARVTALRNRIQDIIPTSPTP